MACTLCGTLKVSWFLRETVQLVAASTKSNFLLCSLGQLISISTFHMHILAMFYLLFFLLAISPSKRQVHINF